MMTYDEFFAKREQLLGQARKALEEKLGKKGANALFAEGESIALRTLKALGGGDIVKALDALYAQARDLALNTATENAKKALAARAKYEKTLAQLGAKFNSKGDRVKIHLLGNTYEFAIEGEKLTIIPKKPRGAKGPRRRKKA